MNLNLSQYKLESMKELCDALELDVGLQEAFSLLFEDADVAKEMHEKNNFEATNWDEKNRRIVKFEMPSDNMPQALIKIVGGGKLRSTTYQEKRLLASDKIEVRNKVKPHVIGAEFIKIKPTFTLSSMGANRSILNMHCKMYAIMPPPFDKIMEGFMYSSAKINYKWYKDAALKAIKMKHKS